MNFHFSPDEQDVLDMLHDFCLKEVAPIAAEIDEEIQKIVGRGYQKTEQLLNEHMDKLHKVAQFLFVNEKMSGAEFKELMEAPAPEKLEEPDPQPLPGESEKEEASAQEERTEEAPAEGTKE